MSGISWDRSTQKGVAGPPGTTFLQGMGPTLLGGDHFFERGMPCSESEETPECRFKERLTKKIVGLVRRRKG